MNYEFFLAKRFTTSKKDKSSISSPIIKIAIAAITIGIALMLVTVATGVGLQIKIREKIAVFKGHIQIINFDNNNSETTQNPIALKQNFYPNFSSLVAIQHIQPYATKAGIIRMENDFEGIVLKGVDSTYDFSGIAAYLIAGKLPQFSQKPIKEVLISKTIANRLQLQLNDTFDVYFMKGNSRSLPNRRVFTVGGIYNSGFKDFDENFIIGDLKHIQKINKWGADKVGGFELFVKDFNTIRQTGFDVYKNIDPMLNSQTILELYPAIFEWLQMFDSNIAIIIAIMILVAGINMITALLVLILEKTTTIGVLKALGSNNWSIRKVFLYNATYIILKGLALGNFIGITLLLVQKYFNVITLNPETYYVSYAPVNINIGHILLLNLGTVILCLLMLLIPSYIITKISPSKAVRFE